MEIVDISAVIRYQKELPEYLQRMSEKTNPGAAVAI
jgi:hypothetical protein